MRHVLWTLALGTCLTALLAPRPAAAHAVGLSRGVYTVDGAAVAATLTFARGELRTLVPALDRDGDGALTDAELAAGLPLLHERLAAGLALEADGRPCASAASRAALTEEDGAEVSLRFTCSAAPRALTLRLALLDDLAAGHRHLAQIALAGAVPEDSLADLVLHARAPTATVALTDPAPAESAPPITAYFELGVEHILLGLDHLVFLLGLVLVGGRLRALLAVVTAFTVGHSLSLALATLGAWSPGPAVVEPAIALSIAYVGLENLVVADAAGRWRITLPFGFIHGFGFAGALAEVGLPADGVAPALLLFNLGVEAGQLAVLALVLPPLLWLARQPGFRRHRVARRLSLAIVAAGLYWFIERTLLAT